MKKRYFNLILFIFLLLYKKKILFFCIEMKMIKVIDFVGKYIRLIN